MTKININKIFSEDLEKEFGEHGFRYVKATNWLVRKLGDISQFITWSYSNAATGFMVTPFLGVRSEEILILFKQVNDVKKADEKFRCALSIDIWRLKGQRSRGEFKVTSETDAHAAASAITQLIQSDALQFFEECKSISDIDRLFNTAPNSQTTRLFSLDNWTRTVNALISAKLAHNPNYEGLIDVYRTMLEHFIPGHYSVQFESLVELLSKIE